MLGFVAYKGFILLSKSLNRNRECLQLPYYSTEGISSFLVDWCHRSSLDRTTFCLRDKAMTDYSYFPQTVPTDDAKKSSVSRTVLTYLIPDLPNTKKEENLTESIGVVPVKYPPKVKLENSSQL